MDLASLWPVVNGGDDLVSHSKDWKQRSREECGGYEAPSLRQAHRRPALLLGGPAARPVVLRLMLPIV